MKRYLLPVLVLVGTVLVLLVAVRHVQQDCHLTADTPRADRSMQHFYGLETSGDETYRWSGPRAALVIEQFPSWQSQAIFQLRMASPRPTGAPPATLHLESGEWHSSSFTVGAEWRRYSVLLPPGGPTRDSQATWKWQVHLHAPPFVPGAGDGRSLGVALSDVGVTEPAVPSSSLALFHLAPGVPLPLLVYGGTFWLVGRFFPQRRRRSSGLAPYAPGEVPHARTPALPLPHRKREGPAWIGWIDRLKRGELLTATEWVGMAAAIVTLLLLTAVVVFQPGRWFGVLAGSYLLLVVAGLVLVWRSSGKVVLFHALVGGIGSIVFARAWNQWVGAPLPFPGGYAGVALGVVGGSWGVAALLHWRSGVSFVRLLRRDMGTFAPLVVVLILHGVLFLFPALAFQTMPVWLFFLGLTLVWTGWWGFLFHRRALEGPFIRRFEYVAVPMLVSLALAYAAYHADIRSGVYNQAVLVLVAGAVAALKAWQAAEVAGERGQGRERRDPRRGMLSEQWGNSLVVLLVLGAAGLFSAISIVKHLNLRSTFFDLGIFEEAVYALSVGDLPRLLDHIGAYCKHVQPVLLLVAPFYLISGQQTWSLLVFQAVEMAAGGMLVYLLGKHETGHRAFGLAVAGAYLLLPPLHWVYQFDFHPIALAPTLVLGSFYALRTERFTVYWIGVVLLLAVKEDIALTVVALGLYVLLGTRHRKVGLLTVFVGIAWFLTAMEVLIPLIMREGAYPFLADHYSALGGTREKIIHTLLTDPQRVIQVMATTGKFENLVFLFLPMGWLVFAAGPVALGAGPGLAMTLLATPGSSAAQLRGFQYGAALLPWIAIMTIFATARAAALLRPLYRQRYLAAVAAGIGTWAVVSSMLLTPLPWSRAGDRAMLQLTNEKFVLDRVIAAVPLHSHVLTSNHIGGQIGGHYEVTMSFGERLKLRVPAYVTPDITHLVLDIHDTERPGLVALLTPDSPFGVLAWEGDFVALERSYPTRDNGVLADYLASRSPPDEP
jgi:uncharacterized membrane protein